MVFEVKGTRSEVRWPAPVEHAWNYTRRIGNFNAFLKRPDIGLSDRFLIASILCQPADQRPWGIVTWLADFYQTTRQTIYTIANSILYPFTVVETPNQCSFSSDDQSASSQPSPEAPSAPDYHVQRAILKLAFPGSVSIRPMREILSETLGITPSIGFISQLLSSAGQLAGQFLSQLDYGHLDAIVALRDETFFTLKGIIIMVNLF